MTESLSEENFDLVNRELGPLWANVLGHDERLNRLLDAARSEGLTAPKGREGPLIAAAIAVSEDVSPNSDQALRNGCDVVVKGSLIADLRAALQSTQEPQP